MHPDTRMLHTPQYFCVHDLLKGQAQRIPDAPALLAPGRPALSYRRLYLHVCNMVQELRRLGVRRHDRVALVLPNGPEMCTAFLAVAASVTAVPLNPAYSSHEFAAYLTRLQPKMVIVQEGCAGPARTVAQEHGFPLFECAPLLAEEAGLFALPRSAPTQITPHTFASPDDVALVLVTSGTTAHPKIVPLTHTNICTAAYDMCVAMELERQDRLLSIVPLFHSHGLISTMFTSLIAGASVVCTSGFSATSFFDYLATFRPTWYSAVPTLHRMIVQHARLHRETVTRYPLRFIRSSSASLSPQVLMELESLFQAPVLEAYGTTEVSSIACNPLPPGRRKVGSVGKATGPEMAIMDDTGALVPAGTIGEIVVRGASVIRGYDDSAATRDAFRDGWFRTGDQGWLDRDGYLFITGRLTEVINRGGTKIAPQEVDAVFCEHPAVAQAVTFALPHVRWGEDVVTAVVLRQNTAATAVELRQFVATRLATFKVPSQIYIVEAIPVGPTGKTQRRSLPEQLHLHEQTPDQGPSSPAYEAPQTLWEEELAGLWATVLGLARVGRNDNFFQRGGDSLLATQLLSRMREVMHVDVSFRRFFATPTLADIAKEIAAIQQARPRLEPPWRAMAHHGLVPLSSSQQRLWFLEQLGISRHSYSLLEVLHVRGPLQVKILEQSFQEIIRRHEVLRTTFINVAGQPLQSIGAATHLAVLVINLQGLAPSEQNAQVHTLAQQEIQRPFDLAQGPLLRVTLLRLADLEHVLLLAMHHIVSDGWSYGRLWHELAVLYKAFTNGQPSPLPALPLQYADFAVWQQQRLHGEALDAQLTYWQRHLTGVALLQVPTDYARPMVQTFQGARHFLTVSSAQTRALKTLCQDAEVTLFMALLAVFQTLLHRYTAQDDIAVGSLIANRNRSELEALIGLFVNTLVLRTDLSGDPSFRALLARVREVTVGAYEHQELPYERLVAALRPARELSRNPLFQVLCVLHNTPPSTCALPGMTVTPVEIDPGIARFDLSLEFWETSEGLHGRFEYSTDLFETTTITRMAGHFLTLLDGMIAMPEQRLSQFPLLTVAERQRLLVEWNVTTALYPHEQCIHDIFAAQAARTPDAIAIVCGDESLTYGALNGRANQVAHYLQACGVGTEALVGLCIERSVAMVVGLLGILKAGAAYVPLDPTYPLARLTFMLEDARPTLVVTQERHRAGFSACDTPMLCLDTHWPMIAPYSDANPHSETTAENTAYLLYTSGSTGPPKGVLGIHQATLNALAWMWQAYPLARHEVCCQKTPISFGDSIQELWGPLLQGRPLVLIPDAIGKDLHRFIQTLALHRVTRLILVPSLLRAVLDTHADLQQHLPTLTLWFAGGEALPSALVQRFRERLPHSRLINLYGASEASDDTTWYDTSGAPAALGNVPIGRPIANTQLYVLDQHLQPLPIGVPGELYIGGAGLTRGYLRRPALTAERFLAHPYSDEPGARLYKTGDRVRYRADGNLEYLGRLDHQVKLHGIRVELGEMEAALRQHLGVREALVTSREGLSGELRLVAYVIPGQECVPTASDLRHFLVRHLPAALVPTTFVLLDTWPLTPSGKVDRQALPSPPQSREVPTDRSIAPQTLLEQQVAALWCPLLHLDFIGLHDNFFELGGHSLLAMQLLYRVGEAMQVHLSLVSFLQAPTIAGMVRLLAAAEQAESERRVAALVPIPRQGVLAASIAQEHFWAFDQIFPGLSVFNIPYLIALHGRLDIAVLEQSFQEILRRHESLRTTFAVVAGQLAQVIAPALHVPLVLQDLSSLPEVEREGEAQRIVQEESARPFDLSHGPLVRAYVLRLSEHEHRFLITLHHIISDVWSLGVLLDELTILYDAYVVGLPASLPALPMQYADFASWQRQWRSDPAMEAQLAYWREQLHEPLPMLPLPTDRPRGSTLPIRTARQTLDVPLALYESLRDFSRQEGSTLFLTCLAAIKMLLYGYSGQEDLRLATLVANRTRRETAGMIGLMVNTVILRTTLRGHLTGREVLQRVQATTLAAYAHQDLPFEELVQTLEGERGLQRASLCQVLVIWQSPTRQVPQGADGALCFQTVDQGILAPHAPLSTFDLIFMLREGAQGLTGLCIYKTDLFDATTISQMLNNLQALLTCLSTQPEQALAACWPLQRRGGGEAPRR